jgi:hypothetical protein
LLTPYPLTVTDRGYEFTTIHQVRYEVYFTDISALFEDVHVNVFSFGFEVLHFAVSQFTIRHAPADDRVGETIVFVLNDFFASNPDIIVYVPMDADGKAMFRLRLFEKWWRRFERSLSCPPVEKDSYTFEYPNDSFVATIMYRTEIRAEAQALLHGMESFRDFEK